MGRGSSGNFLRGGWVGGILGAISKSSPKGPDHPEPPGFAPGVKKFVSLLWAILPIDREIQPLNPCSARQVHA